MVINRNLPQARTNVVKFFKAGYHYWFAIGLLLAFCLHQAQMSFTQRTLLNNLETSPDAYVDDGKSFECNWHPEYNDCESMLLSRLPLGSDRNNKNRWLFLGDSTMKRLFEQSPLRGHLVAEPFRSMSKREPHECWQPEEEKGLLCSERMSQRCKLNDLFDLPYAEEWKRPHFKNYEGPLKYGLEHSYCTDCSGCKSNFLDCQVQNVFLQAAKVDYAPCERKRLAYGGYISIEFARDVEIQTPKHSTTQENIASYLDTAWNEPDSLLLKEWGLPICFINTGNHDAMLPGMTIPHFIKNVDWYLNLFKTRCSHFVWLSNTAPANDNTGYVQTEDLMKLYDVAVKNLISNSPSLLKMTTFINVFESSIDWPHADHIHMDNVWYDRLGKWLITSFMM